MTGKAKPAFTGPSFCNIVATEDSTTVDIILSCPDWMGHAAGDTLTVTLHRGQMYHLQAFKPTTRNLQLDSTHAFTPMPTTINTDISDISGTHIIARDCKRIAIFEGNSSCVIPEYVNHDTRVLFSQSIPIRYAGKEFIVPKTEGYLRFTGLVDSTTITITDASAASGSSASASASASFIYLSLLILCKYTTIPYCIQDVFVLKTVQSRRAEPAVPLAFSPHF